MHPEVSALREISSAPTLPISYVDEQWDPTRLAVTGPLVTLTMLAPYEQFEPPGGDVSRVVVGYLRTSADLRPPSLGLDETAPVGTDDGLVSVLARYAHDRGLRLLRVHRDDVTDDDARRPGFSACLRHLSLREASAIVIPTWDHLAPNDVLRRALCHNATSAGGSIHVVHPQHAF